MKFEEKIIKLRDGTKCIFRSPVKADAEQMIEYLKKTSEETNFMVRYPKEIKVTIDKEEEIIEDMLVNDKNIMIAAFINKKLIGAASISCLREYEKIKHRAVFGISIRKNYWSKGIGSELLKEIIEKASEIGYEQIELGVFSDNIRARALYEKYGFESWGRNKNAFKLKNGTYCDEIVMGKYI